MQKLTPYIPQTFNCKNCGKEFRSTAETIKYKGQYCPECYKNRIAELKVLTVTRTPLEEKVWSDVQDKDFEFILALYAEAKANHIACVFAKNKTEKVNELELKWYAISEFLARLLSRMAEAEGRKEQ